MRSLSQRPLWPSHFWDRGVNPAHLFDLVCHRTMFRRLSAPWPKRGGLKYHITILVDRVEVLVSSHGDLTHVRVCVVSSLSFV
jgi:hypothetical protein